MESQHIMALAILAIVIVGVFGNILSLLMFSHPRMRKVSVNVLLSALSAVDLALLLLSVPVFVIPGLEPWETEPLFQLEYYAYMLKYIYPTNLIMQTCSIYIVVLITLERWIAVCRPLQVMVWCTSKNSKIALAIVFVGALLYNFVRYFEYSIIGFSTSSEGIKMHVRNLRDPEKHPGYVIGYFTVSYLITHFVIPFSIMIFMNGSVCWTMISQRGFRATLTRQQQGEKSTTILLLIMTILFAACNTLTFLLNIIEWILPDFFTNPNTMRLGYHLNDIANLLVILHSATTFIIYYSFSANYRKTLLIITKKLLRISDAEEKGMTSHRQFTICRQPSVMNSAIAKERVRRSGIKSTCSLKMERNFFGLDDRTRCGRRVDRISSCPRNQHWSEAHNISLREWRSLSPRPVDLITWKPGHFITSVQQIV